MANKGSPFERSIAKQLSLWWSAGESDDLLWRTQNSGGRATIRGRKSKTTSGQYGDLASTHSSTIPLLKVFCFELKRGYSAHTIANLLDKTPRAAEQQYEKWIKKAVQDAEAAGAYSWLLITRRDGKCSVVYMPLFAKIRLKECGAMWDNVEGPTFTVKCDLASVFALRLDDFLNVVEPHNVEKLARRL